MNEMTEEQERKWKAWVATRPPAVQRMAVKYPIGTKFFINGEVLHVISYSDDGTCVAVTPICPWEDWDGAVATRQMICKCCMKDLDEARMT